MEQLQRIKVWVLLAFLGVTSCGQEDKQGRPLPDGIPPLFGEENSETGDRGSGEEEETTETMEEQDIKLDLEPIADGGGEICFAPSHTPCDELSENPWHAMGINCPNEPHLTTSTAGHAKAFHVLTGKLGSHDPPTWPILEGKKMVVLSTGVATDLTLAGHFASTSFSLQAVPLPAPMKSNKVDSVQTCSDNPTLVGTGDCSNTIEEQWEQGTGAFDYAELRLRGEVPPGTTGLSYHFAFFSTEYPLYYQSGYNDMFIAWLESENWTGNISFDDLGNPISLNAGFLDYKDAPNDYDCPEPCTAPELQGTAMQGHAATKWLITTTGIQPEEQFTLIFSLFDLSDSILDSLVIVDNFRWNCEGGPPFTAPE